MINIEKVPEKMKALVLHAVGDLRYEEVDVPEIQKNHVLLKIKYCGICSSDIERVFVNGTYHFPTIPGHEFSGQIIGVYDENDQELLGKRASVFPLLPCGHCEACNVGEYAQCSNYNYFGSRCDGAFSEYLVVPKWNLVFFENMDYDVAALSEPTAVSLHATRRIDIVPGKKALVVGSGTIGLLIAMFARNQGADVYIGANREDYIDFIEKIGFKVINTDHLEEEIQKKLSCPGFDYVFEAVGSNLALTEAIQASGNFAKIVVVGNPKSDVQLDQKVYWKILRKQITLTGTWNSNYNEIVNDWKDAMLFMKDNYDLLKSLITIYNLEDSKKAFDFLTDKEETKIKVMFKM